MKTILVALDGSTLAEQALPTAEALARTTGAEIVLMTAIVPPDRWVDGGPSRIWEDEETAHAHRYLESLAKVLREKGVPARPRTIWGRAADMIRVVGLEEHADVIALTTHGRSGLSRWLIGSVADKLLRTSDRPLLMMHAGEGAAPANDIRRILVPLDGSPLGESVLPLAIQTARQISATLVLERVVSLPTFYYAEQSLPPALQLLEEMKIDATAYLEATKERIGHEGVAVDVTVDEGYAAEAIVDASRRLDADLIILCTHGRTGVSRMVLGSVADRVIRTSDRPCLVIPAAREATRQLGHEATVQEPLAIETRAPVPPPARVMETALPSQAAPRAPALRQHRPEGITRRKA